MADPGGPASIALADAVRRLMNATVLTTASDAAREAAAADIVRLAEQLEDVGLRESPPVPDIESMRRGHRPYSPVIGAANPIAPPMTVQVLDDRSVVGTATMRAIHEGPPRALHGGWVATLLDQLLGHANAAAGAMGFTAELTVRYRRPTPYDTPLVLRARTESIDGRRSVATGEILVNDVVTAEATGLFLTPSKSRQGIAPVRVR